MLECQERELLEIGSSSEEKEGISRLIKGGTRGEGRPVGHLLRKSRRWARAN